MIYALLFAGVLVVFGGRLRRVLMAVRSRVAPGHADPELLARLAEDHPMPRRPRATDAMGPWTTQSDSPEFQALLAEVLAVTHG